jgi:hypothetical protein
VIFKGQRALSCINVGRVWADVDSGSSADESGVHGMRKVRVINASRRYLKCAALPG